MKSKVFTKECKSHGLTEFGLYRNGKSSNGKQSHRYRCKKCLVEGVTKRRRKVKQILVEEAGGECVICGYDRCVAALDFHHINPEEKSFGLAECGVTIAIQKLREEAKKCVLLCRCCHAEVEAGITELTR